MSFDQYEPDDGDGFVLFNLDLSGLLKVVLAMGQKNRILQCSKIVKKYNLKVEAQSKLACLFCCLLTFIRSVFNAAACSQPIFAQS